MALSCSTEKVRPPAPALDVAAGAGEVVERAEAHVERAGHPVHVMPGCSDLRPTLPGRAVVT